jgi:hypothetical protein
VRSAFRCGCGVEPGKVGGSNLNGPSPLIPPHQAMIRTRRLLAGLSSSFSFGGIMSSEKPGPGLEAAREAHQRLRHFSEYIARKSHEARDPPPPTQPPKEPGKKSGHPAGLFTDLAVFAASELFAVPICHAGWEAIVSGQHMDRGFIALLVGIPIGLAGASFHWWKTHLERRYRQWLRAAAPRLVIATLLLAFVYVTAPEIYRRATEPPSFSNIVAYSEGPNLNNDFVALFKEQEEHLGKEIQPIIQGSVAYQAWHEHAVVVWIYYPQSLICVLPRGGSVHRAFCEDDSGMGNNPLYGTNSPRFRAIFPGIPDDKLPPLGGVAKHWLEHPDKWKWIGFVEQECQLDGPSYYWRLSNGRTIGVVRLQFDNDAGQLVSFGDDGSYSSRRTIPSSKCTAIYRSTE